MGAPQQGYEELTIVGSRVLNIQEKGCLGGAAPGSCATVAECIMQQMLEEKSKKGLACCTNTGDRTQDLLRVRQAS